MNAGELLEEWQANNDRVHWVQARREELEAVTGKEVPQRLPKIDSWLENHKAAMTKKLKAAAADGEEGEDPAANPGEETEESGSTGGESDDSGEK